MNVDIQPPPIGDKNQRPKDRYLSDSQIGNRYSVSRQTVWRWASQDKSFPSPIKLSPGCTRWKLSDLELWEASK